MRSYARYGRDTMLQPQYSMRLRPDLIGNYVQGVQEKLCFCHNSLQPLPRPRRRCKRPTKLSTPCECTVTPIGW